MFAYVEVVLNIILFEHALLQDLRQCVAARVGRPLLFFRDWNWVLCSYASVALRGPVQTIQPAGVYVSGNDRTL